MSEWGGRMLVGHSRGADSLRSECHGKQCAKPWAVHGNGTPVPRDSAYHLPSCCPFCPLQLAASAEATVVALDADYRPRRITKEFVAAVMAGRPMGISGSRTLAPEAQAAGVHEGEAAAGGEAPERRQGQQHRRQLSRDM